MWHHIIAFAGLGASARAGFGFPAAGNVMLLCEISGFCLNYREELEKNGRNNIYAQLNQFCFFLAYTVFRVLLFPVILYKAYQDVVIFWSMRQPLE